MDECKPQIRGTLRLTDAAGDAVLPARATEWQGLTLVLFSAQR